MSRVRHVAARVRRTSRATGASQRGLGPEVAERLRWCVHPRLYLAQLTAEERAALGPAPDIDAIADHYLTVGAAKGLRVCAFFHPQTYADRLAADGLTVPDGEVPFLHWLQVGWDKQVVPTPLFDDAWYLEHHPALRTHPRWIFHHFLTRGCYQPQWVPSPAGRHHGGGPDDDAVHRQDPLLLPELLHRADEHDLRQSSWLEAGVIAVLAKRERVQSAAMQEQIAKAAELEPGVHAPLRVELPSIAPPHAHLGTRMAGELAAARRDRSLDVVDTVVLVPHCRMSGAARVAGELTAALSAINGEGSVAVVATDLPVFERPGLFPDGVPVVDLAHRMVGLAQPARRDLLDGFLRRLRPRRIIVVNSLLGWQLFAEAGRELAKVADLGAYLFTWEVDEHGHRYGFPVGPLQQSLEHLSWVLFDSQRLRTELVERYLMPPATRDRLHFLRTPLATVEADATGVLERRRAAGEPVRVLWAGRFDRQKRFDLVVEIARLMPEVEIQAWGKPVLADVDLDPADLPANTRLMGVYDGFAQLPLDDVDLLLYTSAWDGIPNVVLEGAQSGLPIVASAVGGVPEVIKPATGYLVAAVDDPAAYVAEIRALLADPAGAARKAAVLRDQVHRDFTMDHYRAALRRILGEGAQA
ncbi:glycosyltransferase family 4 protein [Nocardioides humilatus]|uniref:Glycosyltransferase family 4 protein n=1 Tax=Nocardioides humilatus TaxID=2607660 RepID=A0A5B1LCY8_9ACTN|nr:glycosyltransferase family 4 protein [Nocardioides humilatus]KAA1418515.1 glycosyltransferase family 4 protein [Nocardioides humilatus]